MIFLVVNKYVVAADIGPERCLSWIFSCKSEVSLILGVSASFQHRVFKSICFASGFSLDFRTLLGYQWLLWWSISLLFVADIGKNDGKLDIFLGLFTISSFPSTCKFVLYAPICFFFFLSLYVQFALPFILEKMRWLLCIYWILHFWFQEG